MTDDLFDVSNRVVLITGSSRGLGNAIARGFASAGALVILNGRNRDNLQRAVEQFKREGLRAFGYPFDVTLSLEVDQAVDLIEKEVGPIDILINNAGTNIRASLETVSDETWEEVLRVNLSSVFRVSRAVARKMIERRQGKIINIASLASEQARPSIAPYASAKGGVKMLTKAMAVEWARHNIQVNAIGPGYFKTEMTRPLTEDPKFDAWVKMRTPLGRWGEPQELVGAAIFLASRASDFVTGHILYVDGGFLAAL